MIDKLEKHIYRCIRGFEIKIKAHKSIIENVIVIDKNFQLHPKCRNCWVSHAALIPEDGRDVKYCGRELILIE